MSKTVDREKVAKKPQAKVRKTVVRAVKPSSKSTAEPGVLKLRNRLALTQAQFAPLLPVSVRSLATLERGTPPTESVARRVTELERLTRALSEVIRPGSIGKWLRTPNPAFGGLTAIQVIERGESDRIWETVYFLRSGVAS